MGAASFVGLLLFQRPQRRENTKSIYQCPEAPSSRRLTRGEAIRRDPGVYWAVPRTRPTLELAVALVATLGVATPAAAQLEIVDRPIRFDRERRDLTLAYIRDHYGLRVKTVEIVPRAVVIHWTGMATLEAAWRAFDRVRARRARRHLIRGGAVNVSAHYLVDRDGTAYRLMPERWMARHCIGLNYDSIGVENVGGGERWPLTEAQLKANVALIRELVGRHPIEYLLGHMEWRHFEAAPFFRELDPSYRNAKRDPGPRFMKRLRARLSDLKLDSRYRGPPR